MSVIERERVVTDADVLNRAAELIEERGWCQHTYHGSGGTLCAEGAIFRALDDLGDTSDGLGIDILVEAALGEKSLPYWNDRPERTQAEVVAKLRELAEASGA